MTRDEYRKLVLDEYKDAASAAFVVREGNFVRVLRDVALDAFMHPDKILGELQDETRRRLLQLEQTGVTDP